MSTVESISGVCEVERTGPRDGQPAYLVELPHGATRAAHFDALRERLVGDYPDDLRDFFFVNTDVGAPECASEIARRLGDRGATTVVLRCLVPRTFIDCNRLVERDARTEMTPGLPEYVRDPRDSEILMQLHRAYTEQARRAYESVCGNGGLALTLHTYAPRSVQIDRIDDGIVAALRRAYREDVYERWERRPDVDLICEDTAGRHLAPRGLVEALERVYAAIGITARRNATYRLHPETLGYVHSVAHPGRVLCIELNRERLADPFAPFEEMRIAPERVAHMTAPIVTALAEHVAAR